MNNGGAIKVERFFWESLLYWPSTSAVETYY